MNTNFLERWEALHLWVDRRRWWVRLAFAVVVIPWFVHFAYTRMTTPPVDPEAGRKYVNEGWSEPDDAMADLLAAIEAIPDPPTLPPPPAAPEGYQWVPTEAAAGTGPFSVYPFDVASYGPWDPQSRHHLRHAVDYLGRDDLDAALARVADLARTTVLPFGYSGMPLSPIRHVSKLLVARARYFMAEKHDAAAATRDLRTVLDLCVMLQGDTSSICHLAAIAIRQFVFSELICLSREFDLTRDQAQEILAEIEPARMGFAEIWTRAVDGESAVARQYLDGFYTPGPDGWLVIYVPAPDAGLLGRAPAVLNLLSGIVGDRGTFARKVEMRRFRARRLGDLPFAEARARLAGASDAQRGYSWTWYNPVDGQAASPGWFAHPRGYGAIARTAACDAAAATSLALSVYHTDHGEYPARLVDLVPTYLPVLPVDPVTGGPLRYRLDPRDGYSLYSPGSDSRDDGGPLRDEQGDLYDVAEGPDWIFVGVERPLPYVAEWFLVPDAGVPAMKAKLAEANE